MRTAQEQAVADAVTAATSVGIEASAPKLVYAGSSLIIDLGPGGPMARVGGATDGVRDLEIHYRREVSVAAWLVDGGASVVAPWNPSGPVRVGGTVVAFWTRATIDTPADPLEAAVGLRRCHQALASFSGPLPHVSHLIDEAQRIADSVTVSSNDRDTLARAFAGVTELLSGHDLPEQSLHGDAGLGNVLTGGVWHDWEDACQGPIIWDLASLVSTSRITGRRRARAEATLRAYGDAPGLEQLDQFVAARGLQVLAWSLLASAREQRLRASTAARLSWLRGREWRA
jgi:hypothetical protein